MRYLLTIDDETQVRWVIKKIFEPEGFEVNEAGDGQAGLSIMQNVHVDVVLLDLKMPGMGGLDTLKVLKRDFPEVPVIILTAFGEVQSAIDAIKCGAYDYMTKPIDKEGLKICVHRALENIALVKETQHWREVAKGLVGTNYLVGDNPSMKEVIEKINLVAPTDYTVLVYGETGTGKDGAVNLIHSKSKRAKNIFLPVDCGAIPENLIESELFGYEKGAFTGADKRKEGLLELAEGGTLFLDELANLSLGAQAKLLRVLQDRKVFRLGSKQFKEIDVRIIVATNRNLEEQIREGKIREDLYFRLSEFVIQLPPLRDRKDEIMPLTLYFLEQVNKELGKDVSIGSDAREMLLDYDWPGNIRELRNVVRYAGLTAERLVTREHVRLMTAKPEKDGDRANILDRNAASVVQEGLPLKELVKGFEREIIDRVLRKVGGDNKEAAKLLGVHYTTLLDKLKS